MVMRLQLLYGWYSGSQQWMFMCLHRHNINIMGREAKNIYSGVIKDHLQVILMRNK